MKLYSKADWDKKIAREKEVRRRKSTSRQFNEPLRIFVETKYKDIFREYNELYSRMFEDPSAKKDLTKTKVFKEWLNANGGGAQLSREATFGTLHLSEQDDEPEQAVSEQDVESDDESDDELEQTSTILGQALQSILEEEVADMTSPDFELNVEMVNEIFDELQEDRDLRDVLEGGNEDEGIGLNYFDEIEMDIQPFNYALEVEANVF